ncbi:MAG: hypothetical protein ACLTWZ_07185 [Coprococcus sp.]
MIKVNLQNTAVQNMLTGQNTLDSVFIDGNSILFIEKPEYLKQLYRDEIKARAIKVNLKVAREEIHKRTQDDRYNNLDDMETLKKFRAQTDELRETEKEYRRMLGECENVKMIPVYSGTKLDVTTGDSVEVKQAEFEDYIETEGNKARMVLDILALDADRLERDCQWFQTKGCDINIMTTPGAPLAVEGGTLEEAIAALIEEKAA